MFNLFKRFSKSATPRDYVSAQGKELDITADGQLTISGMDIQLSTAELTDLIAKQLTKLQAAYDELAAKATTDDRQTQQLQRLQQSVQNAANDVHQRDYLRSLLNIVEAYDALAIVSNRTYPNGTSTWDFGWDILNGTALKVAIAVSHGKAEILSAEYADILFARAVHCLRQMKYAPDESTRNRAAQVAVSMLYTYLIVTYKLRLNHWQQHDALKYIHIAILFGSVTEQQTKTITADIASRTTIQASGPAVEQAVKAVAAFTLSDVDKQRLTALIY